ncbi:hypothetical protein P691DRAFT_678672, partial [Macrolepiota fuliginosa MF-IS2]
TYGFRLWYFGGAPLSKPLSTLCTMQHNAAIWITGGFRTSPTGALEVIAGLIPIHLHISKLARRTELHAATVPPSHAIRSLVQKNPLSTPSLQLIKDLQTFHSPITDIDRGLADIIDSFNPLSPAHLPGSCILDLFPNQVSFHHLPSRNAPKADI